MYPFLMSVLWARLELTAPMASSVLEIVELSRLCAVDGCYALLQGYALCYVA